MGYTEPPVLVRKISGGWSFTPPTNTTGDDLTIYANTTDARANIKLLGAGNIVYDAQAATSHDFYLGGSVFIKMYPDGNDYVFSTQVTDKNLHLRTLGTGVLKFGTYTAGVATDSTGYITILDTAGNTRKLMVQA